MEYLDYGCRKVTEKDIILWQELFPVITEGYIVYQFLETNETIVGGFILPPNKQPNILIHKNFKDQSLGYIINQFILDIKKASEVSFRGF